MKKFLDSFYAPFYVVSFISCFANQFLPFLFSRCGCAGCNLIILSSSGNPRISIRAWIACTISIKQSALSFPGPGYSHSRLFITNSLYFHLVALHSNKSNRDVWARLTTFSFPFISAQSIQFCHVYAHCRFVRWMNEAVKSCGYLYCSWVNYIVTHMTLTWLNRVNYVLFNLNNRSCGTEFESAVSNEQVARWIQRRCGRM